MTPCPSPTVCFWMQTVGSNHPLLLLLAPPSLLDPFCVLHTTDVHVSDRDVIVKTKVVILVTRNYYFLDNDAPIRNVDIRDM